MATAADGEAVAEIYRPIVADTAISFETDPPDAEEMSRRIASSLPRYPWLVAVDGDSIVGFAYAGPHRTRAAYRWSVDCSVYVRPDDRGSGVGRLLLSSLLEILETQGFRNAFAGISLPNPASVGLHEALGFTPVGIYRDVGWKLNAWHDVGWWQRRLVGASDPPGDLLPTTSETGA